MSPTQGSVLCPLAFLLFINDLEDETDLVSLIKKPSQMTLNWHIKFPAIKMQRSSRLLLINYVSGQIDGGWPSIWLSVKQRSDPSHFDVDPDPGINIWEKWILGSTFL